MKKCIPLFTAFLLSASAHAADWDYPLDVLRPDSLSIQACEGALSAATLTSSAAGNLAAVRQHELDYNFGEWALQGFRTVVQVSGRHPYTLILEDYPELKAPAVVERYFPLVDGAELAGYNYEEGRNDVLLKNAEGSTSLLRVLRSDGADTALPDGMRVGGPAMEVDRADAHRTLAVPAYTRKPSFRFLLVEDARNAPVSKWLEDGKVLHVEWFDQVDVFRFETGASGKTVFVLERSRGEHSEEVIAFGLPYTPPDRETGTLLAHWSFDNVEGRLVPDESGNGFTARMTGGLRLTPGVRGYGVDGVSAGGVGAGELLIPTPEGELPDPLEYGALEIPGEAFKTIREKMTLSFWYAMPPTIGGAYHPYMAHFGSVSPQAQFEADGLIIYAYNHWLSGHRITASGLGNHRLFGMIGPEQPRNKWNHYAVVIDGTEARIYINGDLKQQVTGSVTLEGVISATETASLLKNVWARMDEIRLYDYPLSMEEIQRQFQQDDRGQLARLSFDDADRGVIREGVVRDVAGNEYQAENIEIVPRDGGNAVRFAEEGGKIEFPTAITQGKHIDAVSFAAWVKLPAGGGGRRHLLSSGNHGHAGMFIGFWESRIWGGASQNGFAGNVTPGEWTHIVCSYGYNRIRTHINGEKIQDNDQAFPSNQGWGVGNFSLAYDKGLEIDDVQIFSFNLTDEQAERIFKGGTVERPPVEPDVSTQEKRVITNQRPTARRRRNSS